MAVMQKVTTWWRVIKDVDLQAIRESVHRDVVLLVVADDSADADRVRVLLSGPGVESDRDPVVVSAPASMDVTALPVKPTAALCVARSTPPSHELAGTRRALSRTGVPVITVIVGEPGEPDDLGPSGTPVRLSERVRLATLDAPGAREHLAASLVAVIEPDVRLALARRLPVLRPALYELLIDETARANAGFALTTGLGEVVPVLSAPLAVGDIVVLTKNQLVMSYRLALAAGRDDDPRQMIPEIVSVLGGGLLFRQVARSLIGLMPVIGIVPKIAVAYGGTWAIGRAMVAWMTEGREAAVARIAALRAEGLARGRLVGQRMVESRTGRRDAERQAHALPVADTRAEPAASPAAGAVAPPSTATVLRDPDADS